MAQKIKITEIDGGLKVRSECNGRFMLDAYIALEELIEQDSGLSIEEALELHKTAQGIDTEEIKDALKRLRDALSKDAHNKS